HAQEQLALVAEGAIKATFAQAGGRHEVVERGRRVAAGPELVARRLKDLLFVEAARSSHAQNISVLDLTVHNLPVMDGSDHNNSHHEHTSEQGSRHHGRYVGLWDRRRRSG